MKHHEVGEGLLEELETLPRELGGEGRGAGDVAARARETRDQPGPHGVSR